MFVVLGFVIKIICNTVLLLRLEVGSGLGFKPFDSTVNNKLIIFGLNTKAIQIHSKLLLIGFTICSAYSCFH